MGFIKIDLKNYPRKSHLEYFLSLQYPYVGITADVDVTKLYDFCKRKNISFYLTFLHLSAIAADDINEFRQRLHNKEVLEYDECPTSHIELLENGTYCYCTLHHHMPFEEYIEYAEKARKDCRENQRIYYSGSWRSNRAKAISQSGWVFGCCGGCVVNRSFSTYSRSAIGIKRNRI